MERAQWESAVLESLLLLVDADKLENTEAIPPAQFADQLAGELQLRQLPPPIGGGGEIMPQAAAPAAAAAIDPHAIDCGRQAVLLLLWAGNEGPSRALLFGTGERQGNRPSLAELLAWAGARDSEHMLALADDGYLEALVCDWYKALVAGEQSAWVALENAGHVLEFLPLASEGSEGGE